MKNPTAQLPYFSNPISGSWFVVIAILFPLLYIVLQLIWPNASIMTYQLFCFALPSAWLLRRAKLNNAFSQSNLAATTLSVLIASVLLSLAVNLLSEYWEGIFPIPDYLLQAYDNLFHANQPWGFYFDILQIAFVPAIAEELLFRGVILTKLSHKISANRAITIQAILFALYHLNPWHLPFLLILGVFFGWIYFRTNNLALAMLAHFINNALGVIWYYKTGHL